ncbi:MAG TPA: PilZ domain-containing protein [Bryobacteraceae bacterium]|nr:PilZ domain-containing protein [Bryobacteraceae bacterium]
MDTNVPYTVLPHKEASVQAIEKTTPLERRSKIRYPVSLNVKYRTVGRSNRISGVGRTLNMSSGGLLIAADHRTEVGTKIELNVEWPSMLDGSIPLQLVAVGRVVRCLEAGFALSFTQYQFRTMSRKLHSLPNDGWDGMPTPMIRSAGA